MTKKKMKIEYINSFGPPEYVELRDNNIGIVVSEKETKGVELSADNIDLFWQTMNEIEAENSQEAWERAEKRDLDKKWHLLTLEKT